jgi:hypothetical protein
MHSGTSEMRFFAALEDVLEVKGVLCLFEGACPATADAH